MTSDPLQLADYPIMPQPIPWIGRTNDLGRGGQFLVGGPISSGSAPVTFEDVLIMTELKVACPLSRIHQERRGFAFMIYNGTGYMHDPRVVKWKRIRPQPCFYPEP